LYADIECILQQVSTSNSYQQHIPHSVGFYIHCSYDSTLSEYKFKRGVDCIKWFINELQSFAENVETVFLCDLPMSELTDGQVFEYENAHLCHICEKPFGESDIKVRDHCHLTSIFRGAAHQGCNVNLIEIVIVLEVFHNLSGYDY